MSAVVAATHRIALRHWRDDDDAAVTAMRTPAFLRWLDDADTPPRPAAWAARMQERQATDGFCFWIVERVGDGAVLGYCGLKRVDAEGTALRGAMEIGWGIDAACWGQGIATEAARLALHQAFAVQDAPFVVAFTVAGNAASIRVMEKIGMTRRPDLDFHDPAYSDALNPTIVYRIDAAPASRP